MGRARTRHRRRRTGGETVAPVQQLAVGGVRHDGDDETVRWRTHLLLVSDVLHRRPASVHQQRLLGLQHVLRPAAGVSLCKSFYREGLTENAGHEIAGNEIVRHDKYRDRA